MEVCRLGFKTYILARVSQLYSRTIDKIRHGSALVKNFIWHKCQPAVSNATF